MKKVICALLLYGFAAAPAQAFPTKPICFLVPFGPGGVGDITARAVAQKLGESLGQQIVIDNRPGAGGIVATQFVAKAEPDGRTMLLLNNAHAVSMSWFKSLPYDTLRDIAPAARALIEAAPERVLWGTDFPHPNVRVMPNDGELVDLFAAMCDDENMRRRILVENPRRLYWES